MGAVQGVGGDRRQGRRADQGGGVAAEGGAAEAGEEGAGGTRRDHEDGDDPVRTGGSFCRCLFHEDVRIDALRQRALHVVLAERIAQPAHRQAGVEADSLHHPLP